MKLLIIILVLALKSYVSLSQEKNNYMKDIGRNCGKKEVKELLSKPGNKERNDLKGNQDDPFDYYELSDGRILLVLGFGNGTGTLYRSENDYKAIINEADVRKEGEHVLNNLITNEDYFLNHIPVYVEKLANKLNVPLVKFDKSLESLRLIDSVYKKKNIPRRTFFNEDYLYLISYLGEVYCNIKKGKWVLKKVSDTDIFEPYVAIEGGRLVNTFMPLFKECYENYESFSIYSVAVSSLL